MSTTTRLLVLGVVRLFQPVHGYEVRRELITWHASEWASVKPGSIYNALKSMTNDGLLEVVSTDQVGSRPERTTYRLTLAGEDELRGLVREAWWKVKPVIDPLMGAVAFLGMVSRDEAIAALEERITQVRSSLRQTEFVIATHDGSDSPPHVREMMRLVNARMASEIAWAEAFIARLRAGEYAALGDEQWHPVGAKTTIEAARPRRAKIASGAAKKTPRRTHARPARASSGTRTNGARVSRPRSARR
jgi:DNA-binding PadR family transcriptional regulator